MNKRFFAATLVGAVTLFFAGFVIWGLALSDWMLSNMNQSVVVDPPLWVWMIASMLLWSAVFTYVFAKWGDVTTLAAGARAGALLGLMIAAAYATGMHSMSTMYTGGFAAVVVDILANTVWWGIGGAAIGWTLGHVSD